MRDRILLVVLTYHDVFNARLPKKPGHLIRAVGDVNA
jgi:hypothetical protein